MESNDFYEEMPKGLIRVTLDGERWYIFNDEKERHVYPAVTWVLDEGLPKGVGYKKWLASMSDFEEAESFYKAAGDRGTKVHKGIERLLRGAELSHSDTMPGYHTSFTIKEWMLIRYFTDWQLLYQPKVIALETDVYNHDPGYAGTVDLICEIDKGLLNEKNPVPTGELVKIIVDFKTSSYIYDSHIMQVASYAVCEDVDMAAILRLGSKHKKRYEFKIINLKIIVEYFELFRHVHAIWKHNTKGSEPKYADIKSTLKL